MYVVCRGSSTIRLYNMDTYSPLDVVINVDRMIDPHDIVVSRNDRQLYLAELDCIWRVSVVDHSYMKWLTTDPVMHIFKSLSLTSCHLLVTSWSARLHQYDTTDKQLLRVVDLREHVKEVSHAVETTRGTFVVSHRGASLDEQQYAVSELFGFNHNSFNFVVCTG